MKHGFFKTIALALAMTLVMGVALAEVRTTGSVNMRSGPGLSYEIVTCVSQNKTLTYLGESNTDERGVVWYKVSLKDKTGWVSSKYAVLEGEDATPAAPTATPEPAVEATAEPTSEPVEAPVYVAPTLEPTEAPMFVETTPEPTPEATAEPEPTEAPALPAPVVELSGYYACDLVTAANEIGLISYREVLSEAPYQYYDSALILAGNQNVENIVVYGEGYEVYGVRVGMSAATAMAWLNAAGLDYSESANGITYEHRAAADSPFYVDANGHDSCINLWVNDANVITEIDWSTYTG